MKLCTLTLLLAVGVARTAVSQAATLTTTFTNPTPADRDRFSYSVAMVGTDQVIIGANKDDTGGLNAGAAYLFRTDGTLVRTITNSTPVAGEEFGSPLASLGSDRVLIGAVSANVGEIPSAGAVYLFGTNGVQLTRFTKTVPVANDLFGYSLAVIGTDRVAIGVPYDDTGASEAGSVYLFNTNGNWLKTISNPTPENGDGFGWSIAAVGNDRLIIGAHYDNTGASRAGSAYLFNIDGNLLTTFNNPFPNSGDDFGAFVAALGSDRVIISAWLDDSAATDAGSVYLFRTDGTLLKTFSNPTPAINDRFGSAVAAVGTDRVLVGAWLDDTVAENAGAAYLFNTNGTLVDTITNSTPAANESFGQSLAAMESDWIIVGAPDVDAGAVDSGAAYLYTLPPTKPPVLTIIRNTFGDATLSWSPDTPGFELQETSNLLPADWQNSPSGATHPIATPTTTNAKFFRLIKE